VENLTAGGVHVDWVAVFTGALFFATCGLWYATFRLVEGAKDTAIRQLRGYLSVSPSGLAVTLAQPLDVYSQYIRIHVLAKNHGQTPVRHVLYRYTVDVLPNPLPDDYLFSAPSVRNDANQSLAPGAHISVYFVRKAPLTADELTGIREDSQRIYVWGYSTYEDVFGIERRIEVASSIVGGQFFADYFVQACAGRAPTLPKDMPHPFDFDYLNRHGHEC
jgi:hypothetical protein